MFRLNLLIVLDNIDTLLVAYISVLAQYMNCPTIAHWDAIAQNFGQLKGTRNLGISSNIGSSNNGITVYVDSSLNLVMLSS